MIIKNIISMNKIFLFIFFTVILNSCVEDGFQDKNIVVQHVSSLGDGLHPTNDNSVTRSFIFQYTQKTLTKLDLHTLKDVPILIDSLPTKENGRISEDNMQYTYYLRDDIYWDDGTQFTAKDVLFSTKVMLCPLTENQATRSIYSTVIDSIKLYDDNPLKFTMIAKGINYTNKNIIGGIIMMQKSYWDKKGIIEKITFKQIHGEVKQSQEIFEWFKDFNHVSNSVEANKLVGLGQYKISEYEDKEYIILTKKDKWWGANSDVIYDKALPERIIFKVINDPNGAGQALRNQTIDVSTAIDTKIFMDLRKEKEFNKNYISTYNPQFSYSYMGLNQKPDGIEYKKFFVDKNVRRAIAHLVPVDLIINVIFHNRAERQVTNIANSKPTFDTTLKAIEFDPIKAGILLDNAGWIDSDGDDIRDKVIDGKKEKFSFQLNFYSHAVTKQVVLILQEEFKKSGIELKPNPLDFNMLYDRAYKHEFDAMLGGWGGSGSYSNPQQLWHSTSWSDNGSNFCGFGDAESDEYIRQANETIDEQEHLEALHKLQQKIYDDQPYVFLWSTQKKIAIHRRFMDNNISDDDFIKENMPIERPSVILNNLKLNPNYSLNKTIE